MSYLCIIAIYKPETEKKQLKNQRPHSTIKTLSPRNSAGKRKENESSRRRRTEKREGKRTTYLVRRC